MLIVSVFAKGITLKRLWGEMVECRTSLIFSAAFTIRWTLLGRMQYSYLFGSNCFWRTRIAPNQHQNQLGGNGISDTVGQDALYSPVVEVVARRLGLLLTLSTAAPLIVREEHVRPAFSSPHLNRESSECTTCPGRLPLQFVSSVVLFANLMQFELHHIPWLKLCRNVENSKQFTKFIPTSFKIEMKDSWKFPMKFPVTLTQALLSESFDFTGGHFILLLYCTVFQLENTNLSLCLQVVHMVDTQFRCNLDQELILIYVWYCKTTSLTDNVFNWEEFLLRVNHVSSNSSSFCFFRLGRMGFCEFMSMHC